MSVVSDTISTGRRIDELGRYMAEHVLSPSGAFVCRRLGSCRQSVLGGQRGARQGAGFAAGQLSHVGHHYDLLIDGVPSRTLVIAMETGRSREGVTLKERHAEVMKSASLAFTARNPHMRGVTSALRLAVGRDPGADRAGEQLRLSGGVRGAVHLFDAYAMANMRLCSAFVTGSTKSLGNATMSRNCAPHLAATIEILEPTLCIVQGREVYKALTALMTRRRQLAPQLEQARIAGVDTLVAAFTHPSAMRLTDHWGRLTSAPYLYETVVPALKAARQAMTST